MKSRWQRSSFAAAIAPVVLSLAMVACGGDSDAGGSSAEAAAGKQLAARSGCAGCHGANGEGGVGPTWIGLFGSQVQLVDGSTVVADEAYLTQSITQPDAQKVAGFAVAMPVNQLGDEDVAKIVAYIQSLADATPATPAAGATAPTVPIATAAPVPVATPAPGG